MRICNEYHASKVKNARRQKITLEQPNRQPQRRWKKKHPGDAGA
jgi:hypothetical protein